MLGGTVVLDRNLVVEDALLPPTPPTPPLPLSFFFSSHSVRLDRCARAKLLPAPTPSKWCLVGVDRVGSRSLPVWTGRIDRPPEAETETEAEGGESQ